MPDGIKNSDNSSTPATSGVAAIQQPPPMQEIGNICNNWRDWKNTFDWYLIASGREKASDREKVALFLHVIGKVGRELYNELDITQDIKYEQLCVKFENRCDPQKNVNFERHIFFETYQNEQKFDKYLAALKVKSKSCEFKDMRDSLVLTQLIRGIKNEQLRESMLRKRDLILDEAVAWCRAAEVAGEQAEQVRCAGGGGPSGARSPDIEEGANIERVSTRTASGGWRRAPRDQAIPPGHAAGQRGSRRGVSPPPRASRLRCRYCDSLHSRNKCPAYYISCYRCNKVGHYAKCCESRQIREVKELEYEYDELLLSNIELNSVANTDGWFQEVHVNNRPVNFKLDSGADACVMSNDSFVRCGFSHNLLKQTNVVLKEVSKNVLPVVGYFDGQITYNNKSCNKKIFVLNVQCNNLLSRDVCSELNLLIRVNEVVNNNYYDGLLKKYDAVFKGIGRLPGLHKITVDKSVPPVVSCSRKIPIKLRPKLQEELNRLVSANIIERVDEPTDWVSNIVLVEKPDGKIRLCIDPRHLNKAIKRSHFQLPTMEEITSNLTGAKFYSHLDASKAFFMIALDKDSSNLCTFATPFGRYRFLRLPFGVCSATEVFHNAMCKSFAMEGVEIFVDDLLVYGSSKEEHDRRLEAVLRRAAELGVRFNRDKCVFGAAQVKYLGHTFSEHGMRPDTDRVRAIQNMPPPTNKKDLERILGMINYLSRFISNYAELVEPLRNLIKRNVDFQWNESHDRVLNALKEQLARAPTLRFYNPNEAVTLTVDASAHGLGACLLQGGRPVAFAARKLTAPESRWAQIEKEMLAIVYGCTKFHQYIYGHKLVTVESDHKPLESIFKKPLNETPVRLQRMLLRLQKYVLKICYVPGRLMFIADTLSRAPDASASSEDDMYSKVDIHVNSLYENCNISGDKLNMIKLETDKDIALNKVRDYYRVGWPLTKSLISSECKQFWSVKDDLHVINGVVFRGDRIVIPERLRKEMLERIHEGHLGIEKCKMRARDVMWWPGMSAQIERTVAGCDTCAERAPAQPREPLVPHAVPEAPWQVVAADIFHMRNKNYLLVVDYYSKFVEVVTLYDLRSSTVISQLKSIFARHGIPKKFISDNALQFMSSEFASFRSDWEFEHVTSSPYYARSNGLAERNVQTVKNLLEKALNDKADPHLALLNFRNTAISGENYSPAQLLMGRRLNTRLPICNKLLKPNTPNHSHVVIKRTEKNHRSKKLYDQHTKRLKPLQSGERVRIREAPSAGGRGRWVNARVHSRAPEPRSYWVSTPDGGRYRRNRQHIRAQTNGLKHAYDYDTYPIPVSTHSDVQITHSERNDNLDSPQDSIQNNSESYTTTTRSGRQIRPPKRFDLTGK